MRVWTGTGAFRFCLYSFNQDFLENQFGASKRGQDKTTANIASRLRAQAASCLQQAPVRGSNVEYAEMTRQAFRQLVEKQKQQDTRMGLAKVVGHTGKIWC